MISKNKQSRLAGFRILLAIPTAFALLLMFSFTSLEKTTSLLKNNVLQPALNIAQSSFDEMQNPQQKTKEKGKSKTNIPARFILMKDVASINSYYPGGYEAWSNFLKSNYKYPQKEIPGGPQGTIYVSFTVTENGEIKDPKIYKGIEASCDKEAFRVISNMPNQKPVLKDGKPISVQYILPIFLNLLIPHAEEATTAFFATPDMLADKYPNTEWATTAPEDKPLLVVEQNPEFKGGYEAMLKFIKENIHYPDNAIKSGIQGTVFVRFVVNRTGKITNIKVLRGIGSGCDEEAIRIVKEMPDWIPGKNFGKVVPVMFQIPIKFQLKTTYTPVGNS